jgi:hypothetical protein
MATLGIQSVLVANCSPIVQLSKLRIAVDLYGRVL